MAFNYELYRKYLFRPSSTFLTLEQQSSKRGASLRAIKCFVVNWKLVVLCDNHFITLCKKKKNNNYMGKIVVVYRKCNNGIVISLCEYNISI